MTRQHDLFNSASANCTYKNSLCLVDYAFFTVNEKKNNKKDKKNERTVEILSFAIRINNILV